MARMIVAAAQLGPADEDKARNVDRIVSLLSQARKAGALLVTLPELAITPYFCLESEADERYSDTLQSVPVRRILHAVEEAGINLVLPLSERDGRCSHNAAILIAKDGRVVGRQRKVHLPYAEQRHFTGGREFAVHELAGCLVGVLICADRAFPESWRVLGLRGAHIVCTPYNTSSRQAHGCPPNASALDWARDQQATRMRAAAMANGYFVVAAGKGGRERDVDYIADSMIISPWGEVLSRAQSEGDELVIAEIDLAEVSAFRAGGRYDRRVPSAYDIITADTPQQWKGLYAGATGEPNAGGS